MTNAELQKLLRQYPPDKEIDLAIRMSDHRGVAVVTIDMECKLMAANTTVHPEKITLFLVEGEER